jgi:hypothetical protein
MVGGGQHLQVRVLAVWRVYGGALMVVAGIAAFVEAHRNMPVAATTGTAPESALARAEFRTYGAVAGPKPASGLSPTAYDLLGIGAWAPVVLGAITVVLGLVRYAAAARPRV